MSNSENDKSDVELDTVQKHRFQFFALIGHCTTEYQKTEDYLPQVFAAALGISETKAHKIFNLSYRLETKLVMISEALSDAADEHQERWKILREHIRAAAKARNEIAHGEPVHNAGRIEIEIREGGTTRQVVRLPVAKPSSRGMPPLRIESRQIVIQTCSGVRNR